MGLRRRGCKSRSRRPMNQNIVLPLALDAFSEPPTLLDRQQVALPGRLYCRPAPRQCLDEGGSPSSRQPLPMGQPLAFATSPCHRNNGQLRWLRVFPSTPQLPLIFVERENKVSPKGRNSSRAGWLAVVCLFVCLVRLGVGGENKVPFLNSRKMKEVPTRKLCAIILSHSTPRPTLRSSKSHPSQRWHSSKNQGKHEEFLISTRGQYSEVSSGPSGSKAR